MIIGWLVTGDPMVGVSIGSLELFTKLILYYGHERAWYRLSKYGVDKDDK